MDDLLSARRGQRLACGLLIAIGAVLTGVEVVLRLVQDQMLAVRIAEPIYVAVAFGAIISYLVPLTTSMYRTSTKITELERKSAPVLRFLGVAAQGHEPRIAIVLPAFPLNLTEPEPSHLLAVECLDGITREVEVARWASPARPMRRLLREVDYRKLAAIDTHHVMKDPESIAGLTYSMRDMNLVHDLITSIEESGLSRPVLVADLDFAPSVLALDSDQKPWASLDSAQSARGRHVDVDAIIVVGMWSNLLSCRLTRVAGFPIFSGERPMATISAMHPETRKWVTFCEHAYYRAGRTLGFYARVNFANVSVTVLAGTSDLGTLSMGRLLLSLKGDLMVDSVPAPSAISTLADTDSWGVLAFDAFGRYEVLLEATRESQMAGLPLQAFLLRNALERLPDG